jgi:calpain-15
LTALARGTIHDIFQKFDLSSSGELSRVDFMAFLECVNVNWPGRKQGELISESEFRHSYLSKYESTQSEGMTERGLRQFFRKYILKLGEEFVLEKWFRMLGYDKDLVSIRSRCFVFTLHRYGSGLTSSESEVDILVQDALQTDIDSKATLFLVQKTGKEMHVQHPDAPLLPKKDENEDAVSQKSKSLHMSDAGKGRVRAFYVKEA